MTVQVDVTADDIAHGVRKDCDHCPIARAITRALPGYTVEVSRTYAFACKGQEPGLYADLPGQATKFISQFDAERAVKPLSFELDFQTEEEA